MFVKGGDKRTRKIIRVFFVWFAILTALFVFVESVLGLCFGFLSLEPFPPGFEQRYLEVFEPKLELCVIEEQAKLKCQFPGKPFFAVDAQKKPGVFRIIIIGGSFAAQWNECHGFVARCREMFANKKVEIINFAFGGYDSYRVEVIANEVAGYDPDCVLIVSGNNERDSTGRFRPWNFTLRRRLRQSWIFRFFDDHLAVAKSKEISFKQRNLFFRKNISNAVKYLQSKGIKVVISTLNANQRHWPPCEGNLFSSGNMTTAKLLLYDKNYDAFWRVIDNVKLKGEAQIADTLFLKARALDEQGNTSKAAQLYCQAKDWGGQRVAEGINAQIHEIAREFNLLLLDFEEKVQAICPDGIPGSELYFDYCHVYKCRNDVFMGMLGKFFWENRGEFQLFGKKDFKPQQHEDRILKIEAKLVTEYKLHLWLLYQWLLSPKNDTLGHAHRFMFDMFLILNSERFVRDIVKMADWNVWDNNVPVQQINTAKANVYDYAGQALMRQGRNGEAALMFEKSLDFNVSRFVLLELACCRFMLADHDSAYRLLEKAERLSEQGDISINACKFAFSVLEFVYGYTSLNGILW